MSGSDLITAASGIIQRAMSLESENKLTESLVCFQEGIGLLLKALKSQVAPEGMSNFSSRSRCR